MYKRSLLRFASIQLMLSLAVSCTPEATAPLFDTDIESTANHKDNDGDSYAKTQGLIAEIDAEGMRVRVGDDWYWADDETKIKIDDFEGTPTFGDLQVDDPVHIEHRTVADEAKGYYAKEIKVVDDDDCDDDIKYAKTEGYIEEVDEDGARFRIGEDKWFWVDDDTQYCDDDDQNDHNGHNTCSFDDIQVGVWVKVKHSIEMEEDKGYYAIQVIVKLNHQFAWAEGYVEEVDADGVRFRIGEDMWFWVDEHTQYCDDDGDENDGHLTCSFDDVQVGIWVKTKYRTFLNEDQGHYAMKVLVKPNKQFEWAEGNVEAVDRDGMRFRIGEDMWFWVDGHTRYCDDDYHGDDEECWSFEDVQVGVWAKVKYGTFLTEDKGYYAGKVLLKFGHESVEGEVVEVDGDGMRIEVGDDWFWADEHTVICIDGFEGDPTFGDIETGAYVKLEYRTPEYEDKGFYARKIEIKSS